MSMFGTGFAGFARFGNRSFEAPPGNRLMFGYLTIDLLNSDERNVQQRNGPAVIHARVAARRRGRIARRDSPVEGHVVFLDTGPW